MKKKVLGLTLVVVLVIGFVTWIFVSKNTKKTEDPVMTKEEMEMNIKMKPSSMKDWKDWDEHHKGYRRKVEKKGAFTCYTYINKDLETSHQPWVISYMISTPKKDEKCTYYQVELDDGHKETTLESEVYKVYKSSVNSERLATGTYSVTYTVGLLTKKEYKAAMKYAEKAKMKNKQTFHVTYTKK